jgi:hypothetical protein
MASLWQKKKKKDLREREWERLRDKCGCVFKKDETVSLVVKLTLRLVAIREAERIKPAVPCEASVQICGGEWESF